MIIKSNLRLIFANNRNVAHVRNFSEMRHYEELLKVGRVTQSRFFDVFILNYYAYADIIQISVHITPRSVGRPTVSLVACCSSCYRCKSETRV